MLIDIKTCLLRLTIPDIETEATVAKNLMNSKDFTVSDSYY